MTDLPNTPTQLTNTLSLYGLSMFKIDEDEAAPADNQALITLGESLNQVAEVLGEIEGMWDM